MNEIKQASIYLRVLWFNDSESLRPNNINIKLDGETTDEVVFSISKEDNNVGNNALWEATEWVNGITYNYQKEPQKADEKEIIEISNIPYVIPRVVNIPNNYRCNILKNAETEGYSYYTIKMTYIPLKHKRMLRSVSSTPMLNFNGTTIENLNFNGTEIDKVVFNGATVFEKAKTFDKLILANSTLNEETPDFSLTATTDEGLFATEDNDGTSYYFRGAVENNYVKFAGLWWRIIRINGDCTIRLIYDGTSSHANGTSTSDSIAIKKQQYNSQNDDSSCVGWTYTKGNQRFEETFSIDSDIKTQLENWFNDNLKTYESKIATGKFGNDRNTQNNEEWRATGEEQNYAGLDRLLKNSQPTLLSNVRDVYILKVGTITADEVMMAGGNINRNSIYYIYNSQNFWSMTPSQWSGNYAFIFYINSYGRINSTIVTNEYGVRPVINLRNDIEVTGTGTIEDPYVVVGAE